VGRFKVLETPLALDRYKQASTEPLNMLDQVVYPALREYPTNETGKYPIRFRPGGSCSRCLGSSLRRRNVQLWQQNTSTRKLTEEMLDGVFIRARELLR
jgi:hypothetical protein